MPPDDQVHGLSPQVMYEQFWLKEADQRRKMAGVKAVVGLVAGVALAYRFDLSPPVVGLLLGVLVGVGDLCLELVVARRHGGLARKAPG